nr:MAG TPA: hypothetical protein [Microviridae sp.]
MDQQEAVQWAEGQDVVQVRAIRRGEEDKFVFAVGEYVATPHVFDTQEEAMKYLDEHFKLTNMDLAIIGAMCQRLNELNKQQLKNETK